MRIAFIAAVCAVTMVAAGGARAEIEVSPEQQATPLRIKPETTQPGWGQTIIILREAPESLPAPYPGGCFNCSTLYSNQDVVSRSLGRSHALGQKLYKARPDQTILLLR